MPPRRRTGRGRGLRPRDGLDRSLPSRAGVRPRTGRSFAVVRPGNTRAAATVHRNGMEWVGETGKYFGLALQVFRLRRADFDPTAATSPMPPNPPPSD